MNEISVKVNQVPGEITLNFDEIKSRLSSELETFENTVYTDETVKLAKEALAELRKLEDTLETRRKDVKNKCLEPYEIIEKQVKELTAMVEKPIVKIKGCVDDYENRRRAKAKEEIINYAKKVYATIPPEIKDKLIDSIYDSRWENVTASKKEWIAAIDNAGKNTLSDIAVIYGTEEEFREEAEKAYRTRLSLSDAISRVHGMKDQKEKILERERERIRTEEEAKAKKAAEDQMKAEMAKKPQPVPEQKPVPCTVEDEEDKDRKVAEAGYGQEKPVATVAKVQDGMRKLVFLGTDAQYAKVKDYIRFVGADYREVQ